MIDDLQHDSMIYEKEHSRSRLSDGGTSSIQTDADIEHGVILTVRKKWFLLTHD